MDYCDCGTLLDQHKTIWELFERDRAAALRWILRTSIDVATGLEYMHGMGLIHGDLKCNNILLQSTSTEARGFRCCIADMGSARLLSTTREDILNGNFGNPSYAAPEFLRESSMTQVITVVIHGE
jgi:serine/threonine protein kinase